MYQTTSNTSEKPNKEVVHNNLFDLKEEINKVAEQDKKDEDEKLLKEIEENMNYNITHYQNAMNNALKEVMEGTTNGE